MNAFRAPTGITIRALSTPADYAACVALQDLTWGPDFNERVPPAVLRLAQQLGGMASGAFDEQGTLVGFVFGMTGVMDGRVVHWSDMLAVRPDARDRGLGEALKRHQREQLLARGITCAYWTFDPLEARNAWLNFARLGATAGRYERAYYETSDSPLHAGLPTDRLLVEWRLDDPRAMARLDGVTGPPDADALGSVPVINPPRQGQRFMTCGDARTGLVADRLIVAIPAAIQEIKAVEPGLAQHWRGVTRIALEDALARGWMVTDAVRGEGWTGLVLEGRSG